MTTTMEARTAVPTSLPTNGYHKMLFSNWNFFSPSTDSRQNADAAPTISLLESYFSFLRSLLPGYRQDKSSSSLSQKMSKTSGVATKPQSTTEDVIRGENTFDIPYTDLLTWLFKSDYDHDRKILVDALHPERFITTNQAKSMVRSLIGGLRSIGVKPGDSVCVHSFNDILYPIVALAIIGVGARFVGTNPGYTVFELNHHLKMSQTNFVISQPSLMQTIAEAAEQVGIPKANIVAFNDEKTAKQTILGLFASSGTTGLPKVIALSHYAWVAGTVLLPEALERPYTVRRLMFLPAFHAFAGPLTVLMPIKMGQATYLLPRFDLAAFCEAAEKFEINETAVAPPCLQAFIKTSEARQRQLKGLRRVWCGGAPMNIKLQVESRNLFAEDAEIVNIWGMTEIGITVAMRYDDIDRTGAVSKLLANTEGRIINDDGANVTLTGGQGEVQIRSPQVSLGYFGNEKATAETFISDGWVRTGDVGYFQDSKLYLLDRKKEIIKVRGWQVAPAELEAVLISHPEIRDAAVIGIKAGSDGEEHEVPRAYVVRMPGTDISEDEVKAFVLGKLAKYKALDGGVFFVEAIPKSNTGKILKKIIRTDWLGQEQKKPVLQS
ncbi:S-dihydroxybenzoyltransferase [Orbilia brochopaga]|nr:S-dihydroxybenzoyltransferase [Drechslerella brochopaga]